MSNDDTLISKLISETYTEAPDKDQPNAVVDLRNYFERKLNEVDFNSLSDYLIQHDLRMSELTFQSGSKCYRLVYNKSVLDFPSNWSIFKDIKSEDVVYVDQSLDQDFLLDIFSELTGIQSNLALVKEDSGVKLIYLPEEVSRDHVKWFRGFFEKKNLEKSQEEAA
ncbi:hypothetical protein DOM21_00405 [Bacteriovorax stolpii]|uniref:Uncharacterized protein n=1 Tax=Bacteriovorax stolpii TaxID=960 RepID=A0A2K9NX12_BACTC|nr:hypothetical protein [Bacteriovorax stolpii]AUO00064.1 hypothetical protein C0V70_18525 [Bacteriovorax stolpii]QDK39944.1 hypothetical protein DOM21_00405 [Bacteriovorax stolpii]TDP54042.1 hypothetical protein C8D79_1325 [Bacteriovorax stolpii]BDT30255.1 hypothetical protein BHI3_37210 [Bacteriovorax sp. HI3]